MLQKLLLLTWNSHINFHFCSSPQFYSFYKKVSNFVVASFDKKKKEEQSIFINLSLIAQFIMETKFHSRFGFVRGFGFYKIKKYSLTVSIKHPHLSQEEVKLYQVEI